jgi:hypothetical protein
MNMFSSLFAQVTLGAPEPSKVPGFVLRDFVSILGAGLIIFLVLVLYVALIRGPKQQTRSRRIYKSDGDSDASASGKRRKKKKTRRREHRTRNPTLAQTGGLPPAEHPAKEAEFFG